jgi:hypothetical protein
VRQLQIDGVVNGQPMAAGEKQNRRFVGRLIQTDPEPRDASQEAGGLLFSQSSAVLAEYQNVS